MKKPTIVITENFHPQVIKAKLAPFAKVLYANSNDDLKFYLQKADGLISLVTNKIDKKILNYGKNLQVVGNFAVGFDNIDIEEFFLRKIKVINTPNVLTQSTAELTLALAFAAARRFPEGEALCRSHRFDGWHPQMLLGQELYKKNVAIVGNGRIGKAAGKLFKAIGCNVNFVSSKEQRTQVIKKLKAADIVSLHLPYNSKTHHWLNPQKISYLSKHTIVINTSRGPIVDETALIKALEQKKIFAAGLDVYENEPKIPKKLSKLKNVVLLPHLGSATETARKAMAESVISGVLQVLDGKKPKNLVRVKPRKKL